MTKIAQTRLFSAGHELTTGSGLPAWWSLTRRASSLRNVSDEDGAALSNVYRALSQVFEADIHDGRGADSTSSATVLNGALQHESLEVAASGGPAEFERGMTFVGGLGSLERAMGLVHARQVLRQNHWVVALVDGNGTTPAAMQAWLAKLRQLRRLLVIWCQLPGGRGESALGGPTRRDQSGLAEPRGFRGEDEAAEQDAGPPSLGPASLGPVSAEDYDRLVKVLNQVKSGQQAAVVEVTLGPGNPVEVITERRFDPSVLPRTGLMAQQRGAAMATAWKLLAAQSALRAGTVVINMLGEPAQTPLFGELGETYFEVAPDDRHALIWCCGLAAGGCRPCVVVDQHGFESFSPALIEEICGGDCPLTFILRPNSAAGELSTLEPNGGTAAFAGLSQALLMYPAAAFEFEQMLECASRHDGPAMIWLPAAGLTTALTGEAVRLGRSESLTEGKDVVLLALGSAVESSRNAAEALAGHGVSAGVVNARFLKPLDTALVVRLRRARALVLVGEDTTAFAAESLVRLALADEGIVLPITAVDLAEMQDLSTLRGPHDPNIQAIVGEARFLLERLQKPPVVAILRDEAFREADDCRWPTELGLNSDTLGAELAAVLSVDLSPEMQSWIEAYGKVGRRNLYLWQWCKRGIELTTLSCVRPDLREHVNDTKLLGVMLDVLLDDVADTMRDHVFLERLIGGLINRTEFNESEAWRQEYAAFAGRVWAAICDRIRHYPLRENFEELFHYDYAQLFNTMRYASLMNRHLALMNLSEHEVYFPHNMHMMIFGTLDVMCSPTLDTQELGKVREVMWHAQCMGQLGNQITTWQRELSEGDYSSGVFARALSMGDLTVAHLEAGDRPQIETAIRAGKHEEHLVARWREHRRHLSAMVHHVRSCDVAGLLDGLDCLMQIEMGSRGQR